MSTGATWSLIIAVAAYAIVTALSLAKAATRGDRIAKALEENDDDLDYDYWSAVNKILYNADEDYTDAYTGLDCDNCGAELYLNIGHECPVSGAIVTVRKK